MGTGADLIIRIATKGATLAKSQLESLGKSGTALGGKMGLLAKAGIGAVAVGMIALAKGAVESVQAFTKFEDKMTQSLAIMQTTTAQQEQMARVAREVATETTISATQSAEAYFYLASAGLDAEQSMSALPQVAKFAQAGMFDMATATDLATDAQSALGLTVKDAQQNLMNLTRVTDVLVKANTLANATVQQFSEALTNKAGSALKVTNKSIEEGVAVLSAFADRGVKGAEAGEKLNQILRDVSRAVKKNEEAWKASGIVVTDSTGNLLNLADVVANLSAGMDGLSDVQKAGLLDQLGLNRGVADAVKILAGAEEQIKNYQHELENAMGFTDMVAQKQMESFASQVQILKNQLNNLAITVGEDLVPFLMNLVENTQIVVERIQNFRNQLNNVNKPLEVMGIRVSTLAKVLSFALFPGTSLVVAGLKKLFGWIGKTNDKYQEATDKANQLNDAYKRQQYYLGFVGSKTEEVVEETIGLEDILDGTNYTVAELTSLLDENGIALDENAKSALETAEAYEDGLLSGIEQVLDAMEALESRQERIHKAETARNKALKKQTEAEEDVAKATEQLDKAKKDLQAVQGLGAKVTNEEQLAIERQKEAINELKEAGELTTIQKLELAVAEENLARLIEESTALSREEEDAIRAVEQADKDLITAKERKAEAVEKVREEQEKLNKLTEQSLKNTLEYAILQDNLNKALAGFGEGTKGYNDALEKMAQLTGVKVADMMKMYDALFAKASQVGLDVGSGGGSQTTSSSSGGGGGGAGGGGTKFPASGGASVPSKFNDVGGGLARYSNTNFITVNPQAILGTPQEIEEAVAKALQEGARRGINVAF